MPHQERRLDRRTAVLTLELSGACSSCDLAFRIDYLVTHRARNHLQRLFEHDQPEVPVGFGNVDPKDRPFPWNALTVDDPM